MSIVETMARAICLVDGAEEGGIQLIPGETYLDYARAALRSVKPEDVSDGMVYAAFNEFHDDFTKVPTEMLRRAIAAAIAAGAE